MNKFHCDCGFVVEENEVEYCPECRKYRCKWCFIPQSLFCFFCRLKSYETGTKQFLEAIDEITDLFVDDNQTGDDTTEWDDDSES